MKKWLTVVVLALVGASLPAVPAQASPIDDNSIPPATTATPAADTTRTILVTFNRSQKNPKASARTAVGDIAEAVAGAEVASVRAITSTTVAVTLNSDLSDSETSAIQTKVQDLAGVKAADPSVTFYPTDTNYEDSLWSITSAAGSKYGVKANLAWPTSTGIRTDNGKPVVVGVVDTGITAHNDLTGSDSIIIGGNVIAGYDFISTGSDRDATSGPDSDPTDTGDYTASEGSSWHGTHVAGIIAAIKNNSGVVGVAPGANIEPLRVLGSDGGSLADVVTGIMWGAGYPFDTALTGLPSNPNPVDVLNLSLGGSGKCPASLQNAINYAALTKGIPVVVAAGNGNSKGKNLPISASSPANCKNVIVVTATTSKGKKASYSNYGTSSYPATIAAPGGAGVHEACLTGECGAIWSTLNAGYYTPTSPTYGFEAGTSMAAPHVAGAIALVKAMHPDWTPAQITTVIRGTATTLSSCSTTKCGRLLNAAKAVTITGFFSKTTAPSIAGVFKVGKKLTADPGTWAPTPTPTSATYQWLRNGKAISKATHRTYKLTKKDKGKKVSVKVTVHASGYLNASATSSSKKVKG